ncbi:unnamed protein product [Rotaria magnacalcarata]|nr:unnamed protein product [Rotaria magnacalcarata]CAF3465798.1 unnamed protein product [Rotaria socialis]CAF1665336.1 unnamed protein product [Rotaria magnacalcarata]CAF2144420.1 unnamed protein product [Rotaria magnacalcarata]CAF2192365.1 unnamed protein product [Rotaria magnacalcarata]
MIGIFLEDLYRYYCTFNFDIELKKVRREILTKAEIKDVAFDGTILYSFEDFETETLASAKHPVTDERITIKMKRTVTDSRKSPEFFYLTNLIVRK